MRFKDENRGKSVNQYTLYKLYTRLKVAKYVRFCRDGSKLAQKIFGTFGCTTASLTPTRIFAFQNKKMIAPVTPAPRLILVVKSKASTLLSKYPAFILCLKV